MLTISKESVVLSIKNLPKIHQLVLSLHYVEELSLYETARTLDLRVSTVYKLYIEGMARIAKDNKK
jgi:DNA-directed RNA polymerase specialized sigma24 family protein